MVLISSFLFAQTVGVELTITVSGPDCQNGQRIAFFDDNGNGKYDRITKFYCDGNYEDFPVKAYYEGYLDKTMSAHILSGNFNEFETNIQIDDSRGYLVAYLAYDKTLQIYDLIFPNSGENPDELRLLVKPNPAEDRIEITNEEYNDFPVLIYDELGKNVTEQVKILSNFSTKISLDISNLIAGVYLIKIGELTGKFVKI